MRRNDVFQVRIEPQLRARLARLRDERHLNVSAWVRDVIAAALDRELLPDLEAPTRQPLAGWKPCKVSDGWGAVLEGPGVAAVPADPRGIQIRITDSRGGRLDGHDHRGRLPDGQRIVRPRLRVGRRAHALLEWLPVAWEC